ncbi:MAG: hypothetical protein RRY42_08045, partial [Mucinivorans sp.]
LKVSEDFKIRSPTPKKRFLEVTINLFTRKDRLSGKRPTLLLGKRNYKKCFGAVFLCNIT